MHLQFDLTELKPVIEEAVRATLAQVEGEHARVGDQLGYPGPEAAAMLGVAPHVLRDCRLRGEIHARKCGKKYIYSRAELLAFLAGGGDR